jgi:signal transduction histidine kinase
MAKEIIDRRVLRILRLSLIVQIFFLAQSSFSPRFYSISLGNRPEFIPISIAPLLIVALIFILLSVKSFQNRITKPVFLVILYILALVTIFSRQVLPTTFGQGPRNMMPFANNFRWEWGMIFFLIIPLVFIAWQYSMREVVFYCFLIIAAEALPLALPGGDRDPFFAVMNLFSDVARSVVLGIVGWIEHQLVSLQRDQQAQIVEANKQLRKYALANEKLAQTQERNRLARELHDTLAHTLSSVSVQLEATKALFDSKPKEAKKMLNETIKNTKNGLTETRRTLVDLRSSELESYGLAQAVRNMGKSAAERGGFNISYHLDKNADILSDEIGHCLYRSAQEAVENILRHANAKNVSISLLADEEEIKLQITDDGVGFDTESINKGNLGIRGMRERVEMLGGTFLMESSEKKGTTITAVLERGND